MVLKVVLRIHCVRKMSPTEEQEGPDHPCQKFQKTAKRRVWKKASYALE